MEVLWLLVNLIAIVLLVRWAARNAHVTSADLPVGLFAYKERAGEPARQTARRRR